MLSRCTGIAHYILWGGVCHVENYAACKQGEEHLHFRECQVHTYAISWTNNPTSAGDNLDVPRIAADNIS